SQTHAVELRAVVRRQVSHRTVSLDRRQVLQNSRGDGAELIHNLCQRQAAAIKEINVPTQSAVARAQVEECQAQLARQPPDAPGPAVNEFPAPFGELPLPAHPPPP